MMNHQKKATVLQYISAVLGKTVDTLLDLKNGHFYMQLLGLLDQWNDEKEIFETDKDRLAYIKKFLQDYYGNNVKIDEFLNFDILLETDLPQCESDIELLLAKIAVVLLGIGVLDKNGQHFIGAAMQLPSDMHFDVMAIIQSVVQAGSTEVCLTTSIEAVLMEPADSQSQINAEKLLTWLQSSKTSISLATKEEQSCIQVTPIKLSDDRKSPPICNLQKSHFMDPSQTSTPKEFRYYTGGASTFKDSPLRTNISLLGQSLQEITSPLRVLNLDTTSPSSPLAQFVQSPQLAHKAFMKQKELEIRKLQQLLNEQIYLKYELQFNLQDKMTECANKDAEISKLQDRIRELLHLRDSYDELQDLKSRHSEMEKEMDKLNKKLLGFEHYKDQCQHLEKESSLHYEEVEKLHLKIETLEMEASKYRDSLKTICHLETQINSLQLHVEVMNKLKDEWEGERQALQGNLEMTKETVDKLRHELEELQARQEENVPGETMGMFMDLQLGELRCKIDDLSQENQLLLQQLCELKSILLTKDDELSQQKNSLREKDEAIVGIHGLCKSREQDIEVLRENANVKEQNIEELKKIISNVKTEMSALNESSNQKDIQINSLESFQCTLQAQIDILKSSIEEKNAECLEYINKVSSLTVTVSEFEMELHSQNQEIVSLSDAKSNLKESLKMKEEELSRVYNDLSNKRETITRLETDKAETHKNLHSKEVENKELCQMNAQLKEEIEQINEQLNAKGAVVDVLTEALQLKNTETLDLMAQKVSIDERAKCLQTTCNELRAENEQYKQQLLLRDSELEQARHEQVAGNEEIIKLRVSLEERSGLCKELQDLVSKRSDELKMMQSEIDEVRNDLMNSENDVKQLKESTHLLNEQLEALHAVKCEHEETINVLNQQIKLKMEECSEYNCRISNLKEIVSQLEIELETKNHELTLLSNTKSHLEEVLMIKEEELRNVNNDISQKGKAIAKLETDCNTTKECLRNKEVENEGLNQMNVQLKGEIEQVKEQFFVQSSAVDDLTEAVNTKTAKVLDFQSQKVCLENELQQIKAHLAARNEELSVVNEEVIKMKASVEEKSSLCKELQDLVSQRSDELQMMQSERDQVRNDLVSSENDVKQLKESTHLLNEQLEALHAAKCENVEMINVLTSQVKAKMEELITLSNTQSHLEGVLMTKEEELRNVNNDLSQMEQAITKLESDHSTTKECLRSKEVENEGLCQKNVQLKEEIEQVKEQLSGKCTAVNELTKAMDIKIAEMLDLQSQKASLENAQNTLEMKCEELRTDYLRCEQQLKVTESELQQIKNQVTVQSATVDDMTVAVNTKTAEALDIQLQKVSLENELQQIKAHLAARNEELSVVNEEVIKMKASVEEKSSLCKELQDLVSQRSDELQMMQSERDQVRNDLMSSENDVKQLKESTHLLNEQLEALHAAKCENVETINVLTNQVKAKMEELITLSNTQSHLEGVLMTKEEELRNVNNDLLQKEQAITKLESDHSTTKEHLRSKEVDIEELCQLNVQLRGEIEQVKEQLSGKCTAVNELTKAMDIKIAEMLDLQSQKASLENAQNTLEMKCEELRTDYLRCEQQLKVTESELQQIKNQVTVQSATVDDLTVAVNTKTAEVLDIQLQKVSLENELQQIKAHLAARNEELSVVNEEVIKMKASVEEKSSLCKELQDLVSQHSDELQMMQSERDQVRNDLMSSENDVKQLKESTHLLNEQLEALHAAKCENVETINVLTNQVKAKMEELITLSNTQSHLEGVLMTKEEELRNVNNDLLQNKQAITKLESDHNTTKECLRSKEVENEGFCQLNAQLRGEIEQVKEQLCVQSTSLDTLTETVNIKNAELLDVKSQKISLEDTLQQIKAHLAARNEELSVVNEEVIKMKASVEEKSSLCKELQDLVSQRSDELQMMLSERDQVRNDLMSSENDVKQLKESTHLLNEQLEALHAVKCELEAQITNLKAELILKSSIINEITETLGLKNADLLKDLTNTVDIYESRISDLTLKLEHSLKSSTNMQDEIRKKENYISQLLKTSEEQRGSIEELTIILESKESSITTLNSELEKQASTSRLLSNDNAGLTDQVQTNEKLIEDLSAQLKSVGKKFEEKCAILEKINAELLHKDALILEKIDEMKQSSFNLHVVQEQLVCKESVIKFLEARLKEVNLSLQNTIERLTDREKVIVDKDGAVQEVNSMISAMTLSLKEKSNEIRIKDSVIDSLTEEHRNELTKMKEETENMLSRLQVKFEDVSRSEIRAFTKQKEDFESQITSLKLKHEKQLSDIAEEHARAISRVESQSASSKEDLRVQLEQKMTSLMEQYEIKIQVVNTEHNTKLNENLRREQQARMQIEQKLNSQRQMAERLEKTIELERQDHERIIQKVAEEHERTIASIEQSHSTKLVNFLAEKNILLEENKKFASRVAELHENVMKTNENHQKTIQDMITQHSDLRTVLEQQIQEQKATISQERQTFHESLKVKTDEVENVQAQLAKLQFLVVQYENKTKTLQDENNSFRDRESKILKDSDDQMKTANEFCNNLRKQLDIANKKLESSENEIKSFTERFKRHELQMTKMKDTNTSLTNALMIERDTNVKMQKRMENCTTKYEEMSAKFECIQKENKSNASEVNKLKTSLDYADRKLREYQHQLDQAGTALLGDASHFKKIIEEKHFDSLDDSLDSSSVSRTLRSHSGRSSDFDSLDDSLDSSSVSRTLRSHSGRSSGSIGQKSNLNETILSGDMVMLKRETLASTTDLRDKDLGKQQTEDRLSICSTSSSQSIRSLAGVPIACLPNAMSCANEPEGPDFEWDRLSELQRRNTLYLPHMKSAYPVEMQRVNKDKISDDTLRLSLLPNRRGKVSPSNDIKKKRNETSTTASIKEAEAKLYKRKAPVSLVGEEMSSESPPKQIRTGPVYQRPGPPTPGKQPRRVSGRFTPSHGKSPVQGGKMKLLGSPIAKPNPRQTVTPRRSPRLNSSSSNLNENERRESVAFSVGFTPKKSSGFKKMMRQKGFITKDKFKAAKPAETVNSHGKSKVIQQTGQVSFSASFSHQGVSHEIFQNTYQIDHDKHEEYISTQQLTSPKYMLAGKDRVSLQKPIVASYKHLQADVTKQKSIILVNQCIGKVTNLESQVGCRILRPDNLDTLAPGFAGIDTVICEVSLDIVDDSRTTISDDLNSTVTDMLSDGVAKPTVCSEPKFADNLAEVKSAGHFLYSFTATSSLKDTIPQLASIQKPQQSFARDLFLAQWQNTEKKSLNNFLPENKESPACNFIDVSIFATNKSPSPGKKFINDNNVNINKEIPLAKRRLTFSKVSADVIAKSRTSDTESKLHNDTFETSDTETNKYHNGKFKNIDKETKLHNYKSKIIDTEIKLHNDKSKISDTEIKLHNDKSKTNDTEIKLHNDKSKISDTEIKLHNDKSKISDTEIKQHNDKSKISDTEIKLHNDKSKISDTEIKLHNDKSKTNDTEIKLHNDKSKISDTEIKLHNDKSKISDTEIKQNNDKSKISDTEIKLHNDKSKISDTEIKQHNDKSKISDTEIKQHNDKSKISDTEIKLHNDKSKISDIEIKLHNDKSKISDTELKPRNDKSETNYAETELESSLHKLILKKRSKRITIKKAIQFFNPNSQFKRKSKLSISNNDAQEIPAKILDSNNPDAMIQSEEFLTERHQTVSNVLDERRLPLQYLTLDSENDQESEYAGIKVQEKFRLPKLMKNALPFWKKHMSKNSASELSTHHNHEVDQLPSKSEMTASQCGIDKWKLGTTAAIVTAAPKVNKLGSNVAKLRANFEHSEGKETHINTNLPSSNLKRRSFFKKITKLKELKSSSYQVSPKPKPVATFTDTVKTSLKEMSNDKPQNLDILHVHGTDLDSSMEPLFEKMSPLQYPAKITSQLGKLLPKGNCIQVSIESPEIHSVIETRYLGDSTPHNKKHKLFPLRANKVTPIRLKQINLLM